MDYGYDLIPPPPRSTHCLNASQRVLINTRQIVIAKSRAHYRKAHADLN